MARTVCITGAAGFIGSHLVETCLNRGDRVIGIDNLDDFYSPEIKKRNLAGALKNPSFQFHELDLLEEEKLRELLIQEKPDLVFHLAARAGVRPSLQNPTLYMRVNVEGTTGLLQAAVLAKVKRVVMASSSSVYGNSASVPFQVSEKNLRPISPYGASKLASEAIGYSYAENYRLPVIALRFFTVYGPRQRPDLAIHKFMRLIDENKPIEMFGDGSTSRDYTFIDDIIEGVLASAEVEISTSEIPFRVYNIGSESPISLKEMISAIETVTGKKAQLIPKPEQTGDVKRTFADVTQSEKDFKYRPKESFAKGLEKFWSWYQTEKANRR